MDTRILKLLKEQIEKIKELKKLERWSPEYRIWKNTTSKTINDLFGKEYLELFESTIKVRYIMRSNTENQQIYFKKLEEIKRLLEGFIQEQERLEIKTLIAIGKTVGLSDYDLHTSIKNVSKKLFEDGHYAEAVESAFKEVIKEVKNIVKDRTEEILEGDRAMNRAFGFERQEPVIKFNNIQTREEKDEQKGIMFLFKGIVGIRNRKAHENIMLDDPCKAIEYLALASLLMRLLDEYAK